MQFPGNVQKCTRTYSSKVNELTIEKIKEILGNEYFEKYKNEELEYE